MSIFAIAVISLFVLIAAAVLIILLSPITYRIEASGRAPYRVELSVTWLWRVFSLHLAYFQGKAFFKQLYILGMQKIGPVKDYEQWLAQRVDEEYRKAVDDSEGPADTASAMAQAMRGGGQGPQAVSEPQTGESAGARGTSFDDARGDGRRVKNETRVEKSSETVHEDTGAEARAARYDAMRDNPEGPVVKDEDEVVSKVSFNRDGSVKEKIITTFSGMKDRVTGGSGREKRDSDDPAASFTSQIPTLWFMKHILNMELWRQLLLVARRCYDHSKPRDIALEGCIGLGDPFRGGMLSSLLFGIWPEQAEHIDIDYINFHLEGSGHIKGRIVLGVLAWHGTRFILSKPMRAFIGEGIRVIWTKRRESKRLEKLRAQQS